jgi:hypothetical protein
MRPTEHPRPPHDTTTRAGEPGVSRWGTTAGRGRLSASKAKVVCWWGRLSSRDVLAVCRGVVRHLLIIIHRSIRVRTSREASHAHWLRCTALRSPGQHQRPVCATQDLEAQEPNWQWRHSGSTQVLRLLAVQVSAKPLRVLGPALLQIRSKIGRKRPICRHGSGALGRNRRQTAKPFGRAKLQPSRAHLLKK